jgi:diguanylate cyclase (GGDEF)-like protein
VPLDWDDETKISAKEELSRPTPKDRDRAYLIVLAGSSVGEMYKITSESTVIGRGQQADIQVIDEGISRRHAEIVHQGDTIVIRDLGSTNGTYCNGDKIGEHQLSDGDKIQVGSTTILKFTFHDSLDESFQRQMYESALRDGLTKIFNKKYFLDRLESEFAYAVRHRTPLSLVMFDIDHFKKINDTHGHLAGDYALSTLAKVVQDTIRQEDVFARYGGEEFAVILPNQSLKGAASVAERIRTRVEQLQVPNRLAIDQLVTVSIGAATALPSMDTSASDLVAIADSALYRAKHMGRNRISLPLTEPTAS